MMLAGTDRPVTAASEPFDFKLPDELEAREPPEARGLARDEVRLLVSHRSDDNVEHARFLDLPRFLQPDDLVVVNDSLTVPAALKATREDGTTIALHLSAQLTPGLWVVEPRRTSVRPNERLVLPAAGHATIQESHRGSARLWQARIELPMSWLDYLEAHGKPVAYDYLAGEWPIEAYQTFYGARPGSAEMPSAGRAFSWRVINALARRGVSMATITLHTGVASLEDHEPPYEEWFEVSVETANVILETRDRGGRIIAVGTTVVRALETAAIADGAFQAMSDWTNLIITPARTLRVVDALLTGFHEPRASHLGMLEAIAGREHLELTYRAALANGYLWHEFGDLQLIL